MKIPLNKSPTRIQVVDSGKPRAASSLKAFVEGLPSNVQWLVDHEPANPALLSFYDDSKYQTYLKRDKDLKQKIRFIELKPYSREMARSVLKRLYQESFIDKLANRSHFISDPDSSKSIKNEVDAVRMLHGLYLIAPNLREEGDGSLLEKYFNPNESAWFAYLLDAKVRYHFAEKRIFSIM